MIICQEMTLQKKSASPRLALCLIARDEELLLPRCLASVRDVAHEVVVVDTGSTDGTAEAAASAGATVVHHPWEDDFAAARNVALASSCAPWVLLLDADERLGPGAAEAIKGAMEGDQLDCGLLPLYQANSLDASAEEVLDGRARESDPVLLPRLFRRTPDLAWEGVVHEHVRRWLTTEGRRAAMVDAPIIHLGGIGQLRDARQKQQRNLRLLRRRVELAPRDLDARTYLAQELWNAGLHDEARQEVERAWSDLQELSAEGEGVHGSVVNTATLRVLVDIRDLEFSRALTILDQARALGQRQDWTHPNLDFLTGMARENLAAREADPGLRGQLLQQASLAYQMALGGHRSYYPDQVLPGATTWAGARRLGAVALQLDLPDLALTAFEASLEGRPRDEEALLGRCEALLHLGRASDAMAQLRPMLAAGGPDAWALAARILERGGASSEARQCLLQAKALSGAGMIAPHREAWLEDQGLKG